jgi:hypothetical protein
MDVWWYSVKVSLLHVCPSIRFGLSFDLSFSVCVLVTRIARGWHNVNAGLPLLIGKGDVALLLTGSIHACQVFITTTQFQWLAYHFILHLVVLCVLCTLYLSFSHLHLHLVVSRCSFDRSVCAIRLLVDSLFWLSALTKICWKTSFEVDGYPLYKH